MGKGGRMGVTREGQTRAENQEFEPAYVYAESNHCGHHISSQRLFVFWQAQCVCVCVCGCRYRGTYLQLWVFLVVLVSFREDLGQDCLRVCHTACVSEHGL